METKENLNATETIDIKKDFTKKNAKNLFFQLFKFDKSFFLSFIFYIHIIAQIFVAASYLYFASK